MNNILVTGATGRVGANLLKRLLDEGYNVRAFVMENDKLLSKLDGLNCEIYEGSILNSTQIDRAMKDCNIVIHLAALMNKSEEMSEREYWDINVTGTYEVVRSAVRNKISKFIFSSTDATYTACNPKYSPIDEKHGQYPYFVYGLTKKVGEDILLEAWRESGLNVIILRFAYIMACDEILEFFTIKSVVDILKSTAIHSEAMMYVNGLSQPWEPVEKIMKNTDELLIPKGKDLRSWRMHITDVRDAVNGILLAIQSHTAGEVFNIAGPYSTTWEQAVRYISRKTNRPFRECILNNYWDYELSIEKANKILRYKPIFNVYSMIDSALEYRQGKNIGVIK